MSLREKAREVKAAGEEARGDFTPTGAPLRAYKYWAQRSRNVPDKENFCHFWRVVVFWAPFMAFRNGLERLFSNAYFLGAVAVALLVAIVLAGITWGQFGTIALIVLAALYGIAGLVFGGIYASEKYDHDSWKPKPDGVDRWQWNGDIFQPEVEPVFKWVTLFTLPTSWLTFSIFSIGKRLGKDTVGLIFRGLAFTLGFGYIAFLLVIGFVQLGWWMLAVLGGIVGGLATLFGVVIGLGHLFENLRAYRKQKAAKRPAPTNDKLAEVKAPREPGKVSKFFSGIADFLVLAAQVVRVNKWKICPLVTIDDAK